MKWKVTRNGEDSYKSGSGTSRREALAAAKLFNKWAKEDRGKTEYGIRPVKQ